MNIVWKLKTCQVRDVLRKINKNNTLAYTTVATLLQRLYEKGMVQRKSDGPAFVYTPKYTKKDYSRTLSQFFISKFFRSFGNDAIASFAESIEKLPKDKKEYFLKLLSKAR